MKKINICLLSLLFVTVLGCQSFTGFDFDSDAIVGGGAVAGKDYITGLQQSQKAREYFVKSNANASQKKTVTPGDDQGTGVVWTDDGGIVIPPGCSIEFTNKGYCLDPHLPAPKAGEEMQFVKTSSLIPSELQGTYKNLLKRSAAGDEEVKSNMQRLVWALRTAGSDDVMATHLTDRQREILSECAENGSFEEYVYRHELYGKIVEELKNKLINKISDSTSVRVGDVVYNAFDLLDPDKAKEKVSAHLESLVRMNLHLPVTKSGFNFGELTNGIYTDIKGNASLSFKAKIANSTSQPYTFYPMDYAAQVGSGGSSVGFYAAANSGMRQRTSIEVPEKVETKEEEVVDCADWHKKKQREIENLKEDLLLFQYWLELYKKSLELRTKELMSLPWWVRDIHKDVAAFTVGSWKGVLFWSCVYNPLAGIAINAGDALVSSNLPDVGFSDYYDIANEIAQHKFSEEIIRRNEKVMRMGGKVRENAEKKYRERNES